MTNASLDLISAIQAQSAQLFMQFGPVMTRADIARAMGVSQGALSVMACRHGGARSFFPARLPGGRARYASAVVAVWLCGGLQQRAVDLDKDQLEPSLRIGRPRKQSMPRGGDL